MFIPKLDKYGFVMSLHPEGGETETFRSARFHRNQKSKSLSLRRRTIHRTISERLTEKLHRNRPSSSSSSSSSKSLRSLLGARERHSWTLPSLTQLHQRALHHHISQQRSHNQTWGSVPSTNRTGESTGNAGFLIDILSDDVLSSSPRHLGDPLLWTPWLTSAESGTGRTHSHEMLPRQLHQRISPTDFDRQQFGQEPVNRVVADVVGREDITVPRTLSSSFVDQLSLQGFSQVDAIMDEETMDALFD